MLITIVKTLGTIRKTKHELMIENSADYYAVLKILVATWSLKYLKCLI